MSRAISLTSEDDEECVPFVLETIAKSPEELIAHAGVVILQIISDYSDPSELLCLLQDENVASSGTFEAINQALIAAEDFYKVICGK